MAPKTMETEQGGESTQYESIKTVTNPPSGQIEERQAADSPAMKESKSTDQGERQAENIRYGQAISESGFGGKTTEATGEPNQGGYGRIEALNTGEAPGQTRREQGYGGGNDVGA